jgi:hypothetical protein
MLSFFPLLELLGYVGITLVVVYFAAARTQYQNSAAFFSFSMMAIVGYFLGVPYFTVTVLMMIIFISAALTTYNFFLRGD